MDNTNNFNDEDYIRQPDEVRRESLIGNDYNYNTDYTDSFNLNEEEIEFQRIIEASIVDSIQDYGSQKNYEYELDKAIKESEKHHQQLIKEQEKLKLLKRENKNKILNDIIILLARIKNIDVNYQKIYHLLKYFVDSDNDFIDVDEEDHDLFRNLIEDLKKRKNIQKESIDFLTSHIAFVGWY